jgi:hypothetical protein
MILGTVLSFIIGFLVTFPVVGLILIYLIIMKLTKNRRKSIHKALDYSTIFFIFAVHFLIVTIWEKSFFWLIILYMCVLAMVFVIIHWKVKKEIVLRIVFKGFWRFTFLIFFLAYITLTLYGLIQRVLENCLT